MKNKIKKRLIELGKSSTFSSTVALLAFLFLDGARRLPIDKISLGVAGLVALYIIGRTLRKKHHEIGRIDYASSEFMLNAVNHITQLLGLWLGSLDPLQAYALMVLIQSLYSVCMGEQRRVIITGGRF